MACWIKGTCETNGINIHYIRTGGDKPPLVLLHGLMLNGACWSALAQELEENYDVIMPDARGHGGSSAPNQGYCYDNLAADVVGLIDKLRLTTPVLLGHSMGGMTAAVLASRYPKQLRGVILVDPTFLTPQRQREVLESNLANQHRQILNRPREDYLAEIRVRHTHRPREVIELFAEARFQTSIHAFEILSPPNPDYVQLIHSLDVPSLLVIGEIGSVVSIEVAEELTRLNKHLKTIQIEEAGHAVPYDQPERFSEVVKTFLQVVDDLVCKNSADEGSFA